MIEVVEDPIVISWSEIDAFRQCPFKHHLAYRERWQSDEDKETLARGTAWHEILEAHYSGAEEEVIQRLLGQDEYTLEQTERQELLEWMFNGYLDMWSKDDTKWQIRAVEWKGFAALPNPWGGPSRFMLKVKIDLLAVQRGRLWVWDHKSARNLPNDRELDLDDQFGLYIWCLRQLGYPVAGAVYNCARTQRNKDESTQPLEARFSRTRLSRTDIELDMIAQEAYMSAAKAWPQTSAETMGEPVDLPVRRLLPERNTNTDTCKWKCDFTEACLSSRKGGRIEDMLRAHGYSPRPFREVEIEWKEYKDQNGS